MAHCKKFSKAGCGHMFKHYERAKDEQGEYVKFGNEDIDPTRTHLNYNLAPNRGMTQGEYVRQRCEEVYCLNRKDVNVMCSWVVTMPKDLDPAKTREFMQQTYNFLADRYGEKNVVSAYVHMDEVTPHMHFAFVPVTYDQKKDRYKVSACEVINRTELKVFHRDLEAHLERELGCRVNILNEATKEGNKSIDELKRGTAVKELARIEERLEELDVVGSQMTENGTKPIRIEERTVKDKKGLLGHSERSGVFIEGADAEQVKAIIDRADIHYSLDRKLQTAQKQANEIRSSATAEHNQTVAQAENVLANQRQLIEQGRAERDRLKAEGERKYKELIDKYNSLVGKYNELLDRKKTLLQEVSDISGKRAALEPLRKEVDELQRVYDILTKEVENEYNQAKFKDWSTMPFGARYDEYRKRGELIALYKDGTQRLVGSNEHGGFDDKTLADQRAGLCRVGIFRRERTCEVPESLLKELLQARDREKPISQNLQNYIKQETQVQEHIKKPTRTR